MIETLGLEDEEFWTDPWRTKKTIQRQLMAGNREAYVIGTPQKVSLAAHRSFPLAIIRVFKVGASTNRNFARFSIITAFDLYTGRLSAARAFDPVTSAGPSANGGPPAMIGEGYIIDLARRLKIPALRGDYLVNLICLDKVSSRSRMKLVESGGYEDPAVEEFFRQHLASQFGPPKVSPEPNSGRGFFPVYAERLESPAIPSEPGISIKINRVNLMSAEECLLTASFRLPVEAAHIVKRSPASADEPPRLRRETAIIPITLLLTGSVEPSPQLIQLSVPAYSPLTTAAGQTMATGHFTFDLLQMASVRTIPQTYFIYAFAGPVLSGPVPAAFVTLPPSAVR
jgi:hypothetical protein